MTINNPTYATKATAIKGAERAGIKNPGFVTVKGRIELRDLDRPLYNGPARERSNVDSPVAIIWGLCIEYGARMARKDIINKAVALGVNANTAKAQYGSWKRAS